NGGDPAPYQKEVEQKEQDRIDAWADQFKQLSQRDDDAAIQQLKSLQTQLQSFAGQIEPGPRADLARSYSDQIPTALGAIQSRQTSKNAEVSFQQTVQRYQQAANAGDKAGL